VPRFKKELYPSSLFSPLPPVQLPARPSLQVFAGHDVGFL
jgi:hypothetical protein